MIIHEYPLSWYVDKLNRMEYFSLGRYGDGAWIAMRGKSNGEVNAEGGVFTPELAQALLELLLKYKARNYFFSTPAVMNHPDLECLKRFAKRTAKNREFLDCDGPWDRESRTGGLVPFIRQLQGMKTCIISNWNHRRLTFLNYAHFIEIGFPNCFHQIDSVIKQVSKVGGGCVYLVSAGQPAPLMTQRIHAMFPDVFALDVGSVWDAFLGIGGQRGWRAELYADPDKYAAWRDLYKEILT